jgi:hypothetical protein
MTNQDVVKELLALGKEITNEIKKTSISDDFDAGYKEGLSKANDMIYARLEKLLKLLGEGRLEKEAAEKSAAKKKCVSCDSYKATLQLDDHHWICEDCAQYMNDAGHELLLDD